MYTASCGVKSSELGDESLKWSFQVTDWCRQQTQKGQTGLAGSRFFLFQDPSHVKIFIERLRANHPWPKVHDLVTVARLVTQLTIRRCVGMLAGTP